MASDLPPDPEPTTTPALDRNADVQPGDTPPDSAQTSATQNKDPVARPRVTPSGATGIAAVAVLAVLFAATAVLLLMYVMGVFR